MTLAAEPGPMLAFDAELPHRDALLDGAALAERLGAGSLVRVKYRMGESLRIVYRVAGANGGQLLAARMVRRGRAAAMLRSTDGRTPKGGGPRLDAAIDTVFWTFPDDRRLVGVAELLAPRSTFISREPAWVASRVAEYAPERGVTVRAEAADGSAVGFAKLYPMSTDVVPLARRSGALAEGLAPLGVRIAPTRWFDAERHLIMLEAMPGIEWSRVPPAAWPRVLGCMGRAVATLHEHGAAALDRAAAPAPGNFGRFAPARIARSAEIVGRARPDLAAVASRLATGVLELQVPHAEPVVLHGDCHPKNALVDGDDLALIDLDQAGLGDPAADLGSLLARIHHGVAVAELTPEQRSELVCAVLWGYAEVRALPSAIALRRFTAAALLVERGVRAVNRVHVETLACLDEVLAAADRILRSHSEGEFTT